MFKKLIVGLMVICLSMAVTGAAIAQESTSVLYMLDEERTPEDWESIEIGFAELYPDFNVGIELVIMDEHLETILLGAASELLPDVFLVIPGYRMEQFEDTAQIFTETYWIVLSGNVPVEVLLVAAGECQQIIDSLPVVSGVAMQK